MQDALDAAGMTVNKNTIPGEPSSPIYPSGIRLGTPAATTRGMLEEEMAHLAEWIAQVRDEIRAFALPANPKTRPGALKAFRAAVAASPRLAAIRDEVRILCRRFPVPGIG